MSRLSPYRLLERTIGPYPELSLQGPGSRVGLLPSRGAAVRELFLNDGHTSIPVLCGMKNSTEITGNRWSKAAHLLPFPNRTHRGRYEFEGRTYRLPQNFPWEGGHAIHGLLQIAPYRVIDQGASETRVWVELQHDYDGSEPGYPFAFSSRLRFSLAAEGFVMETRLTNTGSSRAPMGAGWHPYFQLGHEADQLELELPAVSRLNVDEFSIPDGSEAPEERFSRFASLEGVSLNDAFRLHAPAGRAETRLRQPSTGRILTVWQEAGHPGYGYLQVFVPPRRHSVAIEPQSCTTNAFNNGRGLVILDPGQELSLRCGVSLGG